MEIRLLEANEIECRIGTIKENGISLLLYKDARVDQRILDETFGINGWMRKHRSIDGNLFCTISIYDPEKNQWVDKEDVGTPSLTEQVKGLASDSFKRAATNVGIGRELYSAPYIWIPDTKVKLERRKDGKLYTSDRFNVKSIIYDDNREIKALSIENGRKEVVFSYGSFSELSHFPLNAITKEQRKILKEELKRTGTSEQKILDYLKVKSSDDLSVEQFESVLEKLKKIKSAA